MGIGQEVWALRLFTGMMPDRKPMLARLEQEIAAKREGAIAA
jgi:hypothetical protein